MMRLDSEKDRSILIVLINDAVVSVAKRWKRGSAMIVGDTTRAGPAWTRRFRASALAKRRSSARRSSPACAGRPTSGVEAGAPG